MKKLLSQILRSLRLIKCVDRIYFYYLKIVTHKTRRLFRKNNPDVILPPDYYLFETFDLDYQKYFFDSINAVKDIIDTIQSVHQISDESKILDWGCGSGRLVRHFKNNINASKVTIYGTDYNKNYIEWCKKNIPEVNFNTNTNFPPLPYDNNFFDVIYGISIFTHMSEEQHIKWMEELKRILKPGGILYLSFQSDAFTVKLTEDDLRKFKEGKLVVKSNTTLGHRTYSAFQPDVYIRKISYGLTISKIIKGEFKENKSQQDIWLFTK